MHRMSWWRGAAGAAAWLSFLALAIGSIIGSIWVIQLAIFGGERLITTWICRFICLVYGLWRWFDQSRSVDGNAQRNLRMIRHLEPILQTARGYFSARIIIDYDREKVKEGLGDCPVMFACHPHGIWGIGVLCNLAFRGIPRLVAHEVFIATLNLHFAIPIWREFCLGLGLVSVGKKSLTHLLKQGKDVAVVLGGAREALDAYPGVMALTLRSRRGFFKIALETGSAISPVITFGEVELFKQVRNARLYKIQVWLMKRLSFALPLYWGRFGPVAAPTPLTTIVGEPIRTEKVAQPTDKDIQKLQEAYIDGLQKLHSKYDLRYSPQPTRLVIK